MSTSLVRVQTSVVACCQMDTSQFMLAKLFPSSVLHKVFCNNKLIRGLAREKKIKTFYQNYNLLIADRG